jgi:hypothetical protein
MGVLRQAIRDTLQRDRGGTSRMTNWPAPLLGLNTRDNIASMMAGYARQLDNFYPTQGECLSRGGSQIVTSPGLVYGSDTSGFTALMTYGNTGLLVGASNGLYNVTPGAAVTLFGTTGSFLRAMSVNFTNSAGNTFLWACNGLGVTYPVTFDGTTYVERTGTAITGVDARKLCAPWVFKRKIFAIEAGTMNAWYLPTDSIIGAASKLPLGSVFRSGGQLVAGATWTNDGGDGPDDYCAFISSEGQIAVYGGIDPSSSSSWQLVGVYECGRPPSRRCFAKYGGDLLVLTQMGVLPLSKITASDVDRPDIALSDTIRPTLQNALASISLSTNDDRYCIIMHPGKNALLINIPALGTTPAYQYVMNVITGAWCRFTGLAMDGMCIFNGNPIFGSHDAVSAYVGNFWNDGLAADSPATGAAVAITYTAKTAYQKFGSPNLKRIPLMRPQLAYSGNITLGMAIATDYSDVTSPTGYATINTSSFSFWDFSTWDVSLWSAIFQRINNWLSVPHNNGYAHSLLLQVVSSQATISWSGTDVIVAGGGVKG